MLSIAKYIHDNGLTQDAFAKSIGISAAMLSYCLRGLRRPGVDVALRMKEVTGLSLDEIYRGVE